MHSKERRGSEVEGKLSGAVPERMKRLIYRGKGDNVGSFKNFKWDPIGS